MTQTHTSTLWKGDTHTCCNYTETCRHALQQTQEITDLQSFFFFFWLIMRNILHCTCCILVPSQETQKPQDYNKPKIEKWKNRNVFFFCKSGSKKSGFNRKWLWFPLTGKLWSDVNVFAKTSDDQKLLLPLHNPECKNAHLKTLICKIFMWL